MSSIIMEINRNKGKERCMDYSIYRDKEKSVYSKPMTGLTAKSGEIKVKWLAKLVTVCKLKGYELLMKKENIQW